MNRIHACKTIVMCLAILPLCASGAAGSGGAVCPRPAIGSTVTSPPEVRASNGQLHIAFAFRSEIDDYGLTRYCYIYGNGIEAPTLRVNRGDEVIIDLTNDLTPAADGESAGHQHAATESECSGGPITEFSTNLHFHGLEIPPVCHQDDVIHTSIQPSGHVFQYRFRIPADQPPGLYWYHPHPHGYSENQVLGGASGALIVEGIAQLKDAGAGSAGTDSCFPGSADPHWNKRQRRRTEKWIGREGRRRWKRYIAELRSRDLSPLSAGGYES